MPGIARALQQRQQLDRAAVVALNEPGAPAAEDAVTAGTRRALLQAALGLCCSAEVIAFHLAPPSSRQVADGHQWLASACVLLRGWTGGRPPSQA